jgi:hypothetical protein
MLRKFLSENLKGRYIGTLKSRCEGINKINIKDLRYNSVEWIHLAQNRDQWRGSI